MVRLNWPRSLRSRLALVMAMALTPSVLLALLQGAASFDEAERTRSELFELRALAAVDEVRAVFAEIRPTLRLAALSVAQEMDETGDCAQTLSELRNDYPWSTQGLIFDRNGNAICGTEKAISVGSYDFWPGFVARPDFTISNVVRGRLSGKLILLSYHPMPLHDPDRFAVGVGIDMSYLSSLTHTAADQPRFALVNRRGAVVLAEGKIGDEAAEHARWLPADLRERLRYGDRKETLMGVDGVERRYYMSAIVPGQLWSVTSRPKVGIAEVLVSSEGSAAAAPILACLIALFAVNFAAKQLIVRHLTGLQATAVAFGRGERRDPIAKASAAPEEIERFEDTLFAMGDALTEKNKMLTEMLDIQKRLLLEAHHRVKNNLQTISSLMSIEARRFKDGESRQAIRSIQERLYSLSMVHKNLYASANLEHVELGPLIGDIATHSHSTLAQSPKSTRPRLELDELTVDTSAATPIALFLSEAIANAYKHGAADDPDIRISLSAFEDRFTLCVSNRVGRADDESVVDGDGLGGRLMDGFAAQIKGRFEKEAAGDRFIARLEAPLTVDKPLFSLRSAPIAAE